MQKILVIVESPAKAKTIKKYLGKNYAVLASMGHMRDLPKSQLGVDIEKNFEPKYITIRGKGDLLSQMKKEAKGADRILLATDPDREGEAISWHLARVLNIPEAESCRIAFNEITKTAVQAAVKNPRPIDVDLVNAQQARRILDRVVGYKISPLLWKKVKKGLSAGRVQSVSTRLIVDREHEIENFVAQEYWSLTAKLSHEKDSFLAKFYGSLSKKMELPNEATTQTVIDALKEATYAVKGVKKSERKRMPSPPFITSTMQQEAARKLGFTAGRTMSAAQQLYEGVDIKGRGTVGLITYMRTDSVRVAGEAQEAARAFIGEKYGVDTLPATSPVYRGKKEAQDAHEAIRPTDVFIHPSEVEGQVKPELFKLYKLVWERFVASQMAPAIYNQVQVEIAANNYLFKATGSKIKVHGFTILYEEGKDVEEDEKEQTLPILEEGQNVKLQKLEPKQHFTQPPPRFTEATLVKTLEEKGIGRPSTYAPTISTIVARGYVVREKKQLRPTELGTVVTELLKGHFKDIVDVGFTANMEQQLDDVEEGKTDWVKVLADFYTPFAVTLASAEEAIGQVKVQDEVSDVPCEKCGRYMVYKMGRFGKFLACPGFPECRNAKPIVVEAGANCPLCDAKILVKKSQKGKKYFGCEKNPTCSFMTWDEPLKEPCPKCGGLLLSKTVGKKVKVTCFNSDCDFERSEGK